MKKNTIKVVALAIAGALLPIIGFIAGSTSDDIYVDPVSNDENTEEEEVSQDTQ